jgi:hypothetical protein
VKAIIEVITKKEEVDVLPGKLYSIEQHSDGVVTEFSINYLLEENSYQRYFVIKTSNDNNENEIIYMGNDKTKVDPEHNIFFTPTGPLNETGNEKKINQTI